MSESQKYILDLARVAVNPQFCLGAKAEEGNNRRRILMEIHKFTDAVGKEVDVVLCSNRDNGKCNHPDLRDPAVPNFYLDFPNERPDCIFSKPVPVNEEQ